MTDYFYALLDKVQNKKSEGELKLKIPKILGLTASPIKNMTENPNRYELEEAFQTLADNLYSKFIHIDKEEIKPRKDAIRVGD